MSYMRSGAAWGGGYAGGLRGAGAGAGYGSYAGGLHGAGAYGGGADCGTACCAGTTAAMGCGPACGVGCAEASGCGSGVGGGTILSYVGPGGDYVQETTYKYVGIQLPAASPATVPAQRFGWRLFEW